MKRLERETDRATPHGRRLAKLKKQSTFSKNFAEITFNKSEWASLEFAYGKLNKTLPVVNNDICLLTRKYGSSQKEIILKSITTNPATKKDEWKAFEVRGGRAFTVLDA